MCKELLESAQIPTIDHEYSASVTAPTCTDGGYVTYLCACGHSYVGDHVSELGHATLYHDGKKPSCTEGGWSAYETCERCDYSTYYALEKVPHTPSEWITDREPTETQVGGKHIECTECGEILQSEAIPELTHNYVSTTVEPTCIDGGYTRHTCSICGDSYTDSYVLANGHTFGDWSEQNAPMCEREGVERRDCLDCDHFETRAIEAIGHSFGAWGVTSEPTCTQSGEASRKCEICQKAEHRELDKIAHVAGERVIENEILATCTTDGGYDEVIYCIGCSLEMQRTRISVIAAGHTDSDEWVIDTTATCEREGERHKECAVCRAVIERESIEKSEHAYTLRVVAPSCTEQGYTVHTCSACADSYTDSYVEALSHELTLCPAQAANCLQHGWDEYEFCQRCDYTTYVEIPLGEHSLGEWYVDTAPTCETAGVERRDCTVCEHSETREIDALGHDIVSHAEKTPSCIESGWAAYEICSHCDHSTYKEIAAFGHTLDDWTQTKAPTCTEKGIEIRYCQNCEHSETRDIDALGHSLEHHTERKPTCLAIGWSAYEVCTLCDYSTYSELSALGHTLGGWTHTKAPT